MEYCDFRRPLNWLAWIPHKLSVQLGGWSVRFAPGAQQAEQRFY